MKKKRNHFLRFLRILSKHWMIYSRWKFHWKCTKLGQVLWTSFCKMNKKPIDSTEIYTSNKIISNDYVMSEYIYLELTLSMHRI